MRHVFKRLIIPFLICLIQNVSAQHSYYSDICPFDPDKVTTFCTEQNDFGISYKAETDGGFVFSYGVSCLSTSPSAAWFAMKIDKPGDLAIKMSHSENADIDFICVGPFDVKTKADLLNYVCENVDKIFEYEEYHDFGIWGDLETGEVHAPGKDCYPAQFYTDFMAAWPDYYNKYQFYLTKYNTADDKIWFSGAKEWALEKLQEDGYVLPDAWDYTTTYSDKISTTDLTSECYRGSIDEFPRKKVMDCSYSDSYSEICYIENAKKGQWYLMLITNYSEMPGTISFNKIAGQATTDCSVIVDASSTGPYCTGQTIELTVHNAPDNATFLWSGPNGFSSTLKSPTIPNATVKDAGIYEVQMFVDGVESPIVAVPVDVFDASDTTFVQIHLKDGESYMVGGVDISKEGTHKFTFENIYGCDSTVIYNVIIGDSLEIAVPKPQPVCEGQPTGFSVKNLPADVSCRMECPDGITLFGTEYYFAAASVKDAGFYNFTFTNSAEEDIIPPMTVELVVYPKDTTNLEEVINAGETYKFNNKSLTTPGTYTALLKNNYGCDSLVILTLNVNYPAPTINDPEPVCEGNATAISIKNLPNGAICSWTGPNGFTSSAKEISFVATSIKNSGTYSVSFVIDGEEQPELSTNLVVFPTDTTNMETTIDAGETYVFDNKVLRKSGFYSALLRNVNGCDSIVNLALTVLPDTTANIPIHPSTVLSPNGDAVNDRWNIKGIENYPEAIVTIFDRYGKQIYKTSKYADNAWDGTYQSANCPSSDYWYVINIESIDKMFTGHFTLLRK